MIAVSLTKDDLKKIVTATVEKRMENEFPSIDASDRTITFFQADRFNDVLRRAADVRVYLDPAIKPAGNIAVKCDFLDANGDIIETNLLRLRIDLFAHVLITRQPLKKGDELTSNMFHIERRSALHYPLAILVRENEIDGTVARYTIPEGTVLTERLIKEKPLIYQGQTIYIIIKSVGVELTIKGKALQDGQKGDIIRVRTGLHDHSSKIVKGQVIDRQTVQKLAID